MSISKEKTYTRRKTSDTVRIAVTYAFQGGALADALGRIGRGNDQGEYYLTDVIGVLASQGKVASALGASPDEVQGVNSLDQLALVEGHMRGRINLDWMRAGVWMQDPDRVYLDASVRLEAGVRLMPDVHLEGETDVQAGAVVGPDVFAVDSSVGSDARVWYSVLRGAEVGDGAEVGPFASLRPGTRLAPGSKVGTFVETKNTVLGPGSKIPHLSYMGDATIGEDSNVGAGSITCNYDGYHKHSTTIGDRVRIGSDTMLIAPVELGDDSWTGAGSVISKDVPSGSLGVERSQQREVPGYAARRKRQAAEDD